MPSFDVVSKTDIMEVDNAINGVKRETKQRFDLAGTKCDIQRSDNNLAMVADDTMKLTQLEDLLYKYLARRNVDQRALEFSTIQSASEGTVKRAISIKQGIDSEIAKKIVKAVKSTKIKVQIAIQGTEIHISGKKRDDLQETIAFIKGMSIDQPIQYVNFRD